MIIDCFPFFNELDLLEIRLNILNEVVDKFVLVEASKTQYKTDKPFYFEENKDRFEPFLDKIVHIKLTDFPESGGWAMENYQRKSISIGLDKLNLNDDDIIAISDLDEIYNPKVVRDYKKNGYVRCASIDMKYLTFYLNLETVEKRWTGTVLSRYEYLKTVDPQYIRHIKDGIIGQYIDGGWHFGYQGGKDKIYQKWWSCIEPYDKRLIPSKEIFDREFDEKIKDGGYFLYSDDLDKKDVKLKQIDMSLLPQYIQDNQEKYKHMIWRNNEKSIN